MSPVNFKEGHGPGRSSVAFATLDGGKRLCLLSAGADGTVNLVDADSHDLITSHTEPNPINCLLVDPKGSYVAIGVDNKTQVRGTHHNTHSSHHFANRHQ